MTLPNSIAVHHVSQAQGLSSQDIISCSPAVRTNGSSWRRSYFASASEPIRIGLVPTLPRPRNPTLSNTPARVSESSNPLKFGFV